MANVDVKMPSDNEEVDSSAATAPESTNVTDTSAPTEGLSSEPTETPAEQVAAPVESTAAPEAPAAAEVKTVAPATPKAKKGGTSVWHFVLDAVLVVIIVALGVWGWSLKTDNENLTKQVAQLNANPQAIIDKQNQALITKVGLLITLPTSESPTIATVSNADQAKKQSAFFVNAQNGDKVLVFPKANVTVLYRPSTNKIINVGR